MQVKLVEPLEFEFPGYWLTDPGGQELAFGGLNLTARDFAKLGELYRQKGIWHGQQLIPSDWVARTKETGTKVSFRDVTLLTVRNEKISFQRGLPG